jgi:hypothetical protein
VSRFDACDDDEDFPGQWELYQASLRRALKGKRGQRFLRELREALLALPERRLIGGAMCTVGADQRRAGLVAAAEREYAGSVAFDAGQRAAGHPVYGEPALDLGAAEMLDDHVRAQGEGVCAGGAYLWHQKVRAGMDPLEAFASLPLLLGHYDEDGEPWPPHAARVARSVAWEVGSRNDDTYEAKSPEGRWQAFMDWIDRELAGAVSTDG